MSDYPNHGSNATSLSTDLTPERRLLRAFVRAVALAEPLIQELARRFGLSLGDFRAVRVLGRLGEVPVSRFGAELGVPRSTITNLVDRLEKSGVVERVPDPTDRRVTLVRLTPAGRQAVEAIALLRDSDVARRLRSLDPESQEALAALLEKVAEAAPDVASDLADLQAAAATLPSPITKGLEPVS